MSFNKTFLLFKSYYRKDKGFTITKLLQWLLTPLLILFNCNLGKYRNPFLKQKLVALGKIGGCYDNISLENLIRYDTEYKWSALLSDMDEYGLQFLICIQSSKDGYTGERIENKKYTKQPYYVVRGNHRLRILKSLCSSATKLKVRIYETNR